MGILKKTIATALCMISTFCGCYVNAMPFKEIDINLEICSAIPNNITDRRKFISQRILIFSRYIGLAMKNKAIFTDLKKDLLQRMNKSLECGLLSQEAFYLECSENCDEYITTSKSIMNIYKTLIRFRVR